MEDILGVADLFLLASESESFGLAALEAMACEVPVVGYQVGGVPEVVVHGETGLLVPLYDTDALANAAIELLTDEDRLQETSQAARRRACERFGDEHGIRAYEDYYQTLTAKADIR